MVPGLNSNVDRNGVVFHVQTEDLGRSKPIIQSLVYYGGEVVTALEYTYEALATSEEYCADEVRRTLAQQHHRLVAEIEGIHGRAGLRNLVAAVEAVATFAGEFARRVPAARDCVPPPS